MDDASIKSAAGDPFPFKFLPLEMWASVAGQLARTDKSATATLRGVSRRCREAVEWCLRDLSPRPGLPEADLLHLLRRFPGATFDPFIAWPPCCRSQH